MATQTGWGPVIFATWRSPVRLWPSLTTRVKFMQRTWEWNPSTLRSQVSTEYSNSSTVVLLMNLVKYDIMICPLNSYLSKTFITSSPAEEDASWGSRQHDGDGWRNQLNPLLLHLSGIVQQPVDGPATLCGQKASQAAYQAEANGDIRPVLSTRCQHSNQPHSHVSLNKGTHGLKICAFCTCQQLPHWRGTSAPSARLNWTLWNSTSLTSAALNIRTST